jgi:hypothetical protein
MRSLSIFAFSFLAVGLSGATAHAQQQGQVAKPKLYNTAKQKLLEGKQVFSFTQSRMDIAGYCESAKHYDYVWFEMQHSTLEFKDVEAMIAACPTRRNGTSSTLPTLARWAS